MGPFTSPSYMKINAFMIQVLLHLNLNFNSLYENQFLSKHNLKKYRCYHLTFRCFFCFCFCFFLHCSVTGSICKLPAESHHLPVFLVSRCFDIQYERDADKPSLNANLFSKLKLHSKTPHVVTVL